jgi:NSS family neurotransmitter:Na+ symporter
MTTPIDPSVNQRFSSRLGLLLSVLGIAVGTGNIWRFPRIVATNGGDGGAGVFLIAWIFFLFLWSIPLIICEYALGRKYRAGVVGTITLASGRKTTWRGGFIAFVSTAITFFYAVIVGWCLYYFFQSVFHPLEYISESTAAYQFDRVLDTSKTIIPALPGIPFHTPFQTLAKLIGGMGINTSHVESILKSSEQAFNGFQGSSLPMLFHAIAMGLGGLAIWKGVSSIERVNKILIPTLLLIVLLAVARAMTLPGAFEGVRYLFTPQWNQLGQPKIWLEALTQNAWDTGAGWGLFLTYAAYMKREHGVVKNAFTTGIGNNLVSLLSALMIFGTVFAVMSTSLHLEQSQILHNMRYSGPAATGLTFIWMPQLFARMPFGKILCSLFFLGLTFAGFSSLIAQLELPTRTMVDAGMKRSKALILVISLVYLLGIPSARSVHFLSNQDHVWGIALMISGAFVALTLLRYGVEKIRKNEILPDPSDWNLGKWWTWIISRFIPIAATALLIWWLALSATKFSEGQWYNPMQPFSIMTCLVQWGLILAILLILNRWLANRAIRPDYVSIPASGDTEQKKK